MEKIVWMRGCGDGACVEVARQGDEFWIRDSKETDGPVLKFTVEEWQVFATAVSEGAFRA
jgi:Domain of unknown function (DUF397)